VKLSSERTADVNAMMGKGFLAVSAAALLAACDSRPSGPRIHLIEKGPYQALYDPRGRLERLVYDRNGDGKAEVVTLFATTGKPLRAEIDSDGDGTVDRWEYFRTDGALEKVGLSRRRNAQPDEWDFPDAAGGLARRELDEDGDGTVDRVETALPP
jgi:hypothetical protein